jgi:hypothetical protein
LDEVPIASLNVAWNVVPIGMVRAFRGTAGRTSPPAEEDTVEVDAQAAASATVAAPRKYVMRVIGELHQLKVIARSANDAPRRPLARDLPQRHGNELRNA